MDSDTTQEESNSMDELEALSVSDNTETIPIPITSDLNKTITRIIQHQNIQLIRLIAETKGWNLSEMLELFVKNQERVSLEK
tara:strand:- start:315 stop:560 length:246 start_codon:yes stop_codon:yes gene_type:complete